VEEEEACTAQAQIWLEKAKSSNMVGEDAIKEEEEKKAIADVNA